MDISKLAIDGLRTYVNDLQEALTQAEAGRPGVALKTITPATMHFQSSGQAFLKAWASAQNMAANGSPVASVSGASRPSGVASVMTNDGNE